jgi:hypothetical protein
VCLLPGRTNVRCFVINFQLLKAKLRARPTVSVCFTLESLKTVAGLILCLPISETEAPTQRDTASPVVRVHELHVRSELDAHLPPDLSYIELAFMFARFDRIPNRKTCDVVGHRSNRANINTLLIFNKPVKTFVEHTTYVFAVTI